MASHPDIRGLNCLFMVVLSQHDKNRAWSSLQRASLRLDRRKFVSILDTRQLSWVNP
jgi:hypothetical protein